MQKKELLTPAQVCEMGNLSNYALKQAVKAGKLTPIQIAPRTRRFNAEQVQRLFAGGAQ